MRYLRKLQTARSDSSPDAQIRDRGLRRMVHGQAILIVLEQEYDRQLPERGDVHRFMADAGLGRAVAKDAHRDLATPLDLDRERHSGCRRYAGADDRIAPDHALRGIRDQHVSGAALAEAGRPARARGTRQGIRTHDT